jgi:hypothetical protein
MRMSREGLSFQQNSHRWKDDDGSAAARLRVRCRDYDSKADSIGRGVVIGSA